MNFTHSFATIALALFAVSGSAPARANVPHLQPVDFVGIYEVVSVRVGTRSLSLDQYPIREIEIAADLSSNTLKSYVYSSRIDNEGDYFLPPLSNVNLEARVTETRTNTGCEIRTQRSRSSEVEIFSTIETRTKLACRITVKRRVTEYRASRERDSAEMEFTVQKPSAPLETYTLKRLR